MWTGKPISLDPASTYPPGENAESHDVSERLTGTPVPGEEVMYMPQARPLCRGAFFSILLILSTVAEIAYGQSVRIMPMGDSLTSGYRQYVSYRYDLWFDLVDAGFDVDFVGGQMSTDGSPNLD